MTALIVPLEKWMDLRRYRPLRAAGATYREIAAEVGVDWRTVRKYLAVDAAGTPPAAPLRVGTRSRKVDGVAQVIDRWLADDLTLKATVIYERLVADYGFAGHYQRVKMYVAGARERIRLAEGDDRPLTGLHRRFEVTPGAQAQVDWGVETRIAPMLGVRLVYSFHMTLSYSRDPFCCFTTSADMATFWDCHRRAFAHFGGIPGSITYDRTKTVVQRHVAPKEEVPLHPEALAFANHYEFVIDVAPAYRPTAKGRVERQVLIVREHVLAGRTFSGLDDLDGAFTAWLPIRRTQVHRTHREVIAVRAGRDRAALRPLPAYPYLVTDRYLRRVGKDCLVSFEASLYSVPAALVSARMRVELRVSPQTVAIHATGPSPVLLATHRRARQRGDHQIDEGHWDGLPDGSARPTTTTADAADAADAGGGIAPTPGGCDGAAQLSILLDRQRKLGVPVERRDPAVYDAAAGLAGRPR
jgi:transposase